MKKYLHWQSLALLLILSVFLTGCGADENTVDSLTTAEDNAEDNVEDNVESLYKELVGTYDLFKGEVTYVDQPKLVLVPPQVSGTMTISSDQKISQKIKVSGVSVFLSGTLEILVDEKLLLVDNDQTDVISKLTYTWDGEILTTVIDVGTYIEKDFWRKLNNSVIELNP